MIILQKVILYTPDPLLVHFMSITEVLIHQKVMEILPFLIPRFLFFWKKHNLEIFLLSRLSLGSDGFTNILSISSRLLRPSTLFHYCRERKIFFEKCDKKGNNAYELTSSLIHNSIPYHPIVFIPSHRILHLPRVSGTAMMTKIRAAAQRSA